MAFLLPKGMGATLSCPPCCRSLWSCLRDAEGSSLSLICPPASALVALVLAVSCTLAGQQLAVSIT